MAPTGPTAGGYWLVASDGGIFSYGDAAFYGSTGGMLLNKPIVGMAATPDGGGYWLVASDGGIFCLRRRPVLRLHREHALNKPIVGMAATPDGGGYWLVASDGGIFAYGDAQFYGSTGSHQPGPAHRRHGGRCPTAAATGSVAADGGLFNYGTAPFYGSGAARPARCIGMTVVTAWPPTAPRPCRPSFDVSGPGPCPRLPRPTGHRIRSPAPDLGRLAAARSDGAGPDCARGG